MQTDVVVPPPAPAPPRIFHGERHCFNTACSRVFVPVHAGQKYCGACGTTDRAGTVQAVTAPGASWWVGVSSREAFTAAAQSRTEAMRASRERFLVPNQILGEGSF